MCIILYCKNHRCDLNGDGQLDYTEFTKYLSAAEEAEGESEPVDLVSTNTATYSTNRSQVCLYSRVELSKLIVSPF